MTGQYGRRNNFSLLKWLYIIYRKDGLQVLNVSGNSQPLLKNVRTYALKLNDCVDDAVPRFLNAFHYSVCLSWSTRTKIMIEI